MKAKTKRRRIIERDGPFCFYCQRVLIEPKSETMNVELEAKKGYFYMTIDHLIPRAHGGSHDLDNLVLACVSCHRKRHQREELLNGDS